MKNWNLLAAMILVALFAVSCGEEDPTNPGTGDTCTGDGTICSGTVILWCNNGTYQEVKDCADTQQTCDATSGTPTCVGGNTDTDTATDTDTPPTDTDPPPTDTDSTGTCGNSTTDTGEVCDGDAKNCTELSASYTGGFASCKSDCSGYDTSTCQGATDTDTPPTDNDNPPTGSTCPDINTCMGNCQDQACADACLAAGTSEAQTAYNALMTCVSNNCATECGSGGTQESCNTCVSANCPDEYDACFTIDAPVYGTINAPATTFNYIYDGDGDLNTQIQSNQSGLLMNAVFTGTYGASNKPIPGAGATQTIALAIHQAASGGNPAMLAVMQQSSSGQSIVNPIPQMMFPTDAITPGQFDMDPTKEGSVVMVLVNAVGTSDSCLLAYGWSGTTNVTAATNTTAASGGSIALSVTNSKVYYPTETPAGDISGQLTGTTVCPKE